ncbi:MAG TPA: hypothetical protein VFI00_21895 [Kribbella sp.]|nr:hypothetical protein [Kribbella sp.]
MRPKNGRLIALVAAVAVAAIAIGGALAYRQGPQNAALAEAAPLSGSTSPTRTSTPTPAPSKTPTPSTTTQQPPTPSAPVTSSGPTKITLNVSKLPKGRAPQIPYLVGRELLGGAGSATKIPGTGGVVDVGRLDDTVLAVVLTDNGTELVKVRDDAVVRRTAGVSSLVTSTDQSGAAYAASRPSSLGAAEKGGVVYAESGDSVRSLKLPNSWNLGVLALVDGKVYFRSGDTRDGAWKLYAWSPGDANATVIKTVTSPTALSGNGRVAAAVSLINDSGSCSSIVEVATGRQLFRTCENMVTGFTPDGLTAIGGAAYGDGYCETAQAALESNTGRLVREWKGCFHQAVAEDDQHLLMVAVASGGGGDPGTKSAIIRCTVNTGACELATSISTDVALKLGS